MLYAIIISLTAFIIVSWLVFIKIETKLRRDIEKVINEREQIIRDGGL